MTSAVLALVLALQSPAPVSPTQPEELATLDAKLGDCTADFIVKGADGNPIYAASIQVRVRYGAMSVKRMDLEIATGPDGKARIVGLPKKAKPLVYEIRKGDLKSAATQDVSKTCRGSYDVTLK